MYKTDKRLKIIKLFIKKTIQILKELKLKYPDPFE